MFRLVLPTSTHREHLKCAEMLCEEVSSEMTFLKADDLSRLEILQREAWHNFGWTTVNHLIESMPSWVRQAFWRSHQVLTRERPIGSFHNQRLEKAIEKSEALKMDNSMKR